METARDTPTNFESSYSSSPVGSPRQEQACASPALSRRITTTSGRNRKYRRPLGTERAIFSCFAPERGQKSVVSGQWSVVSGQWSVVSATQRPTFLTSDL